MIDRDITEVFAPYWLTASTDSCLTWPGSFADPAKVSAVARFVELLPDGTGRELGEVRSTPTSDGSFLRVGEGGVVLHLTAGDKQLMTGPTLFTLT